jgi:hypothetical protein
MTADLFLKIHQSKITIVDEMARIRKLWENSHTKINGELTGFFK